MDIHVLDTINKANSNIEELISEIISLKKNRDNMYCCHPELMSSKKCDSNCDKCCYEYYEKMKEEMLEKYSVSL